MVRVEGLFANGNDIVATVRGIMHKNESISSGQFLFVSIFPGHLQFIVLAEVHIGSHVEREAEVTSAMETRLLAIDKNSGFIVHSPEIEQNLLALPRRVNIERVREPRIKRIYGLDPYS